MKKSIHAPARPLSARSPLTYAIASILMLAGAENSQAQQATAPAATGELQEIVVTGIRKGIEDAITVKEQSDLIIEAVSAEDIGKLPDLSIADSIARLPGVAAQRDQYGNATQISIRGMGPDFVGTTLNGREQTSTEQTRAVDFASYPAELISQVVVYKTPDAELIGQGLAGTVDIRTVKPLNFNSMQLALNARHEEIGRELPETGKGDRFSGSYIDQFFDHTFGVAIGFARLDDKGGTDDDSGTWGGGTMQYQGHTVNVPYGGLNENSDQAAQRRTGEMAVLQWKPSDQFESEVDMFYSKFHTDDRLWDFQMNLTGATTTNYKNPDGTTTSVIRQPQPVLSDATLSGDNVLSGTISGIRPVIQNIAIGSDQALHSLGWRNTFKATDNLTLNADLNINYARNQQFDIETYASTPTTLGLVGPPTTAISFNSNNLKIGSSINFADRSNTVFTDVLGWSCCGAEQPGYIKYPLTTDHMTAGKLSGTLALPGNALFKAFDFGLNYSDRTKDNSTDEGYLWVKGTNGALYQNGAHIPGSQLEYAGESGLQIPTYDVYGLWNQYFQIGTRSTPNILAKTWSVEEKLTTLFGEFVVQSSLGDMPLRGNAGIQVVRADQSSTAYATSQTSSGQDVLFGNPVLITRGLTDTEILPSINLVGDLGNQQNLRLSLARQMARPNMADMNASNAISVGLSPAGQNVLVASGGNPYLKPFLAKAIDLSYEKYFHHEAYVSAAVFYKHLDSFIVTTTSDSFNFAGLVQPGLLTNVTSSIGEFTTTVNGSGGYIDGTELTASFPLHMISDWLEGFGFLGSFSYTESSVVAPNTVGGSGNSIPLPGLSKDVASLELYYERFGFSARVAERYRSQFIGTLITNFGVPGATYIKTEAPVDAQVAYEFQSGPVKGLQFQFQVQNLKNTPFRTFTSTTGGVTTQKFGQTLLLGVNYKL